MPTGGPENSSRHNPWRLDKTTTPRRTSNLAAAKNGPAAPGHFSPRRRQTRWRLLFLPKYSPDLNPIEQLFSKLKTLVRKAAPRSLAAVSDAIAYALAAVPHSECANYFTNSGYAHN